MYEDHSHVSLKAAVKELGTALGSRGAGWEGVGKLGGRGLDSEQGRKRVCPRGTNAVEVRHAEGKDIKGHKTTSIIKAGSLKIVLDSGACTHPYFAFVSVLSPVDAGSV